MQDKKIYWILIHHTGGTELDAKADTSNQIFEDVNAWHRQNPNVWLGKLSSLGYAIGYTYFIDKSGKLTQGRADSEQSAHTKGYNNNPWDSPANASIGICMAGNFDITMPTQAQISTLKDLLKKKMLEYNISIEKVVPHRRFAVKSCYGNNLSDDWIKQIMKENLIPSQPCTDLSDIVAQKDKQIWNLQNLIKYLLSLIKK